MWKLFGKRGRRKGRAEGRAVPAARGTGPLLQRDYWAVVRNSRLRPSEIGAKLASEFEVFAPEALVAFRRVDGSTGPLEVGDVMEAEITATGTFGVRVIHRDACSLTIGTLEEHPEAGRITFGAYRNEYGDVVIHIRSRARFGSQGARLGYMAAGEAMQTNAWTDFLNALAVTVGDGVIGFIQAETREVPEMPEDRETKAPTFTARAD